MRTVGVLHALQHFERNRPPFFTDFCVFRLKTVTVIGSLRLILRKTVTVISSLRLVLQKTVTVIASLSPVPRRNRRLSAVRGFNRTEADYSATGRTRKP